MEGRGKCYFPVSTQCSFPPACLCQESYLFPFPRALSSPRFPTFMSLVLLCSLSLDGWRAYFFYFLIFDPSHLLLLPLLCPNFFLVSSANLPRQNGKMETEPRMVGKFMQTSTWCPFVSFFRPTVLELRTE